MITELYFHSKAEQGSPRVTIAALIEGQNVKFGASRCSKRDSFLKKKGRLIAKGRALKNPLKLATVPFENLRQWFILHAIDLATEVASNPKLVETKKR